MLKKIKAKALYELGKHFPKILYLYNYTFCDKLFGKIIIHNTEETLNKLCSGKVSMSRFGDGEFNIIFGNQNGFQMRNKKLGKKLKNVIKQNGVSNDFIVGIPRCLNSFAGFTNDAKSFLEDYYLKNRFRCIKLLNKNYEYYDAMVTRLYMDLEDKTKSKEYFKAISSIWNNKKLLIIEGERTRLGVNNDLFDNVKSIVRILAPNENAFDYYEDILQAAVECSNNDFLVLLALGQTATVLAYDLYKRGRWVLDIGHIDIEYEWFLQQAKVKSPVKGKYVNEVNSRIVEHIEDELYERQIVKRVGLDEI